MEGRAPPSAPAPSKKAGAENEHSPLSPRRPETYVIQIPKDQIYRVPPPENAIIAEHFRKPDSSIEKTPPKPCMPRCGWLLCVSVAIVVLSFVSVVAVSLLYFALDPLSPTFSVTHFVVAKNRNPRSHRTSYEISLKVDNDNPRTGIYYEKNSSVALFYGNKKNIGRFRFPTFHQVEKSSAKIRLVVHGTRKGINVTKSGSVVSFALQMNVPVTMNIGSVKIWKNEILINCKFKVSKSKKKHYSKKNVAFIKILSQRCETLIIP